MTTSISITQNHPIRVTKQSEGQEPQVHEFAADEPIPLFYVSGNDVVTIQEYKPEQSEAGPEPEAEEATDVEGDEELNEQNQE